ncbi:hypothetical protein SAMN04488008_104440 [Maribacter orientalis]|uniref:Uncharacterized protein n=2 Tax=Maribacter orientalis TaxID=228957 RepID=A0A1H7RZ63_9FLAO|nr:hypothetical protein SAMN04488008_104440 [Maribacter orientalis]
MSLIFMMIFGNCNSQEINVEDIKGNWRPFSLQKEQTFRYIEIFIDDTTFNYYDYKIGILPKKKFGIKDNSLFLENFKTNQLQEMGTLTILSDSTLRIGEEDGGFILEKINEKPTLEELIKSQVKDDYFQERLILRKENKY